MRRALGIIAERALLPLLFLPVLALAMDGLGGVTSAEGPDGIADHVVISEVLPDPKGTDDGKEYIELYNPTGAEVNIGGWVIDTKSDPDTDALIPSGAKIQAHGFYLIGDKDWTPGTGWPSSPDCEDEITLTNDDGWVRLRKGSGGKVVDIVGWGTAAISETAVITKPIEGQSIERKAQSSSTSESMGSGGADEFRGNGYDSDDNSFDFVLRDTPQPQNSSSPPEPGPPMTVTVIAYPTSIPADGSSTSTITATVLDTYTNPVADGTIVTFTTSLGSFPNEPYTNTTTSGVATATLRSGTVAGMATITATSNSAFGTTTVEFTALPIPIGGVTYPRAGGSALWKELAILAIPALLGAAFVLSRSKPRVRHWLSDRRYRRWSRK